MKKIWKPISILAVVSGIYLAGAYTDHHLGIGQDQPAYNSYKKNNFYKKFEKRTWTARKCPCSKANLDKGACEIVKENCPCMHYKDSDECIEYNKNNPCVTDKNSEACREELERCPCTRHGKRGAKK